MSEPIVLLLLRVPVQLINISTTVLGTLFYAPSYLMFLLIQPLIFSKFNSTLPAYLLSWPFRFLALVLSFTLFLGQFVYAIKLGLQHTTQTSKYILAASLAVSIPGTIYLMRRGYLKALAYLKVPQLKSPKEFIGKLLELLGDIPNIILAIVNVLLVKEMLKTFDFQYHPEVRRYYNHISVLVKRAFFYDLERVFVWYLTVFPWRKNNSKELVLEKDHNADRLAILFILTVQTSLDIPVFILFGWVPFLSPFGIYKRYLELFRRGKGTYKSYVMVYALLAIFQYFCLLLNILALLTGFQSKAAFQNLQHSFRYIHSLTYNSIDLSTEQGQEILRSNQFLLDNYQVQLMTNGPYLLGLGLLQIILLGFRFLVWVSRYKENKLKRFRENTRKILEDQWILQEKRRKQLQPVPLKGREPLIPMHIEPKVKYQCQKKVFKYALQFLVDIPFWFIAFLSGVLKPWDFKYCVSIIDKEFDCNRQKAWINLWGAILFYLALVAFVVLLPLYAHRLRWIYNYSKTQKFEGQDAHHKVVFVCIKLIGQVFKDLPFLPLYYLMTASGAFLFTHDQSKDHSWETDSRILASRYADYMNELITMYYKISLMITPKHYARFNEIYEKDKDRFIQDSIFNKRMFWATAKAIKRYQSAANLMRLYLVVTYLRKGSCDRKIAKIKEQPILPHNLSQISGQYIRSKRIFVLTAEQCLTVTIEIIIGLITLLILLPLTSWRFPTLWFILHDERRLHQIGGRPQQSPRHVQFLHCIVFILGQQLKDLAFLPVTLSAFLFSPLRFVKYCFRYAYHYTNQDYSITFSQQLGLERRYFFEVIWIQSFRNILSVVELIGVGITMVRIRWMVRLIGKAKHDFKKYVRRVLALNSDPTIEEWKVYRKEVQPESEKISLRMCIHLAFVEALKDIPFVFISLLILLVFPWRFNYLWNVLKDQHQRLPIRMRNGQINVVGKRRDIILLMWSILKTDFTCILLNTILILSVYKTKKGIQLAVKNFKRNLVVGFLSYDYKRDLICEIRIMIQDFGYLIKTLLITAMLVRVRMTYIRLYKLYKENQEKEKMMKYSKAIYEETLRSGKDERLTTIGFYAFSKICDYLEPDDLHRMESASKGLYIWTNQQQIWQNQWQKKYKAISHDPKLPLPYRELVTRSYKEQNLPKRIELTYKMIIDEQLQKSLHQPILISDYVSVQKLTYPQWDPAHGFAGGEQELNQAQIVFYYIFVYPLEAVVRVVKYLLRDNSYRLIKQAIFTASAIWTYIFLIIFIIYNFSQIFSIGRLIGFKVMLIAHQIFFHFFFWMRIVHLRTEQVPALKPYDFIREMFDLSVRGGSLAFKKIKAFVITVGTPLYKFIVKIATIVGDGIAKVLEGVREVFAAIVKVIGNIFQGIAALVVGLGMGYLGILAKTMRFFLKFGRLGDLIFTPIALAYLALPLILSYMFYWKGIVIVPASILTIILYIRGYAVLKSAQ